VNEKLEMEKRVHLPGLVNIKLHNKGRLVRNISQVISSKGIERQSHNQ
jgi:hypothetical protein